MCRCGPHALRPIVLMNHMSIPPKCKIIRRIPHAILCMLFAPPKARERLMHTPGSRVGNAASAVSDVEHWQGGNLASSTVRVSRSTKLFSASRTHANMMLFASGS